MSMLNQFFDYKPEVLALDEKALALCQPYFKQMEDIRDYNQLKMLKAFADTQMSSTDMLGTTGYGLWDSGRAKLEQIFAEVMGAEDALVRSQFQSGTHTLAVALFGLLRAGDTLLAATGRPYDTLEGVIGSPRKPPAQRCATSSAAAVIYSATPLICLQSARSPIPPAPQTRRSSSLWITATASSPRHRSPVRWARISQWAA